MEVKSKIDDKFIEGELIYYACDLGRKLKEVWIVPISDAHYGHPLFSLKHFKRTVDFIANQENVFTFLNGDLIEAVTRASKGNIYKQTVEPKMQRKNITELLRPIAHKILGSVQGNHEHRISDQASEDPSELIAEALHIPYRPSGMLVKISFGDYNNRTKGKPFVFWGYFTHGYGGARTKGGKNVKVERASTFVGANFYCMSHDHVSNASPSNYLLPDNRTHIDEKTGFRIGKVTSLRKLEIKTNAYLKWGDYAETGGFPPTDLLTPVIKLLPHGNELVGNEQTVRVEI